MSNDEKHEGFTSKLITALIIAIVAGSSSPWWWDKIFGGSHVSNSEEHYPANMGPLELHTNRQGSDFSPNPEHTNSPEGCARLCSDSLSCKAMTFVNSPNNLPGGDCWLKTNKPPQTPRADMTSAEKVGT